MGLGFDESQVSPAKRDSSDDEEEEETLGERMRKRAKLLEEEAEQVGSKSTPPLSPIALGYPRAG